jgi:hypothetical protein
VFAALNFSAFAQECRIADSDRAREIAQKFAEKDGRCEAACAGCGCKGGPGYRNTERNRCVGWADLNATCGPPPHEKCVKECSPVDPDCAFEKDVLDNVLSDQPLGSE